MPAGHNPFAGPVKDSDVLFITFRTQRRLPQSSTTKRRHGNTCGTLPRISAPL